MLFFDGPPPGEAMKMAVKMSEAAAPCCSTLDNAVGELLSRLEAMQAQIEILDHECSQAACKLEAAEVSQHRLTGLLVQQ